MQRSTLAGRILLLIVLSQLGFICFRYPKLVFGQEQSQVQSSSHRVRDGDYIGGNIIVGEVPNDYKNFLIMWVEHKTLISSALSYPPDNIRDRLLPDGEGKIAVEGRLVFKGARYPEGGGFSDEKYLGYEFKSSFLIELEGQPIKLIFDTEVVNGVSYQFEGTYVEQDKRSRQGSTVSLQGRMVQFRDGKKSTERELMFLLVHSVE